MRNNNNNTTRYSQSIGNTFGALQDQASLGSGSGQDHAKSNRYTTSLGQSYIRDEDEFQIIAENVSSGHSVLGKSVTAQQKMQNLTALLSDGDLFNEQFKQSDTESKQVFGDKKEHMEVLIEHSKKFRIGNLEYRYADTDPIFFRDGPVADGRKQVPNCATCQSKFSSYKNMHYCEFCGYSNCKTCTKKKRCFPKAEIGLQVSPQGKKEKESKKGVNGARGKICKLCDRKFFIKEMLIKTNGTIDAQKILLGSVQAQEKRGQEEIRQVEEENDRNTATVRYKLKEYEQQMRKLEEQSAKATLELELAAQENDQLDQRQNELLEHQGLLMDVCRKLEDDCLETQESLNDVREQQTRQIELTAQIEEEIEKYTRRGRQPKGSSKRHSKTYRSNQQIAQKQSDGFISDVSEPNAGVMNVPSDDLGSLDFGEAVSYGENRKSKQISRRSQHISMSPVANKEKNRFSTQTDHPSTAASKTGKTISLIEVNDKSRDMSLVEVENSIFNETNDDMKSEYDEDEGVQTLAKGKESSKKKRKKRHVKKDQKKRDADEGSACCDTKTKCVIF